MSDDESDVRLFPTSTRQLSLGVIANAGAVVVGLTADSTEWPVRFITVVVGVAVGFALGWNGHLLDVSAGLAIVVAVSVAMLTGTITLWLGFTAMMSVATGATPPASGPAQLSMMEVASAHSKSRIVVGSRCEQRGRYLDEEVPGWPRGAASADI